MKNKKTYLLLFLNIFVLIILFSVSFKSRDVFKTIETEEIIIKSPDSKSYIQLKGGKSPEIFLKNEEGMKIAIKGNKNPSIDFFNGNKNLAKILVEKDRAKLIFFDDKKEKVLLDSSGIFLKNQKGNIATSLSTLSDGGGGIGFAKEDGSSAAIIRGGNNPVLAMFSDREDPMCAFGVLSKVPHVIVSGEIGEEGILMHGGEKSGMMVMDESGDLQVFICKEGIFQGSKEEENKVNKKRKLLTFFEEDKKILFPNKEIR